jgi:non-homologous end joining protein Ku
MDIDYDEWRYKVRSFLAITKDMPPRERNAKLTALFRALEDNGNSHFAEKHCGTTQAALLQRIRDKEQRNLAGFRPDKEYAASAFSSERDMVECLLKTIQVRMEDIYQ